MVWITRKEWQNRDKENPFELFLKDYNKKNDAQFKVQAITAVIILDDVDRGCFKQKNVNDPYTQSLNMSTQSTFLHSAPTNDIR